MSIQDTAELAARANACARGSRVLGAPILAADSDPETVAQWLQWNDPNGCHTAELARLEHFDPYDHDRAWDALADQLADCE